MHVWEQFLQQTAIELGQPTVDRWLRTLQIIRYDACNIYLEAKDSFQKLWFEEHIRPKLKNFVNNNNSLIKVHIQLKGETSYSKNKSAQKQKKNGSNALEIVFEELTPYCTFESFITTCDNIVAYKLLDEVCGYMSRALVDTGNSLASIPGAIPIPREIINPIYLYGPSGSGKSHLLMACANKLRAMGYQAIYCQAERFAEHVVKAMRAAEMTKFRNIYRRADVLIVDDVHHLAKKAATQEEFFHTFNTLHTLGKQIILSSLTSPQHLMGIEPRLISRFEWGCTLPLTPLHNKELIQAIEKRAQFYQSTFAPATIEFLSETFPTSIKSLMRAIEALIKRSQSNQKYDGDKKPLSLQATKILLKDLVEREKSNALTPQKIIELVAQYYDITDEEILSKSQSQKCVIPRQVSMYLCRQHLKMPYMKIGDLFSRDHSTVMASIRAIEKQITVVTSDLARTVNTLEVIVTTYHLK